MRTGMAQPKQFAMLGGRMVVEYPLLQCCAHPLIDEVCLVCHPDYLEQMEQLRQKLDQPKWRRILTGGAERSDSTRAALAACTDDEDNLIFHDAARPLVSRRILDDVLAALQSYRAVDVAVASTDTLLQMDDAVQCIEGVPDRSRLLRSQTPQAFRRAVIAEAHARAVADDGFRPTDDCAVVKKYLPEERIFVVQGEPANMKLTYPEDFFYIQYWLNRP